MSPFIKYFSTSSRLYKLLISGVFVLFISVSAFGQFYYGSQMDFGKNRLQYKKDLYWTYSAYNRYEVYYYEGGKEIANYVAKSAQKNLIELERMFDYQSDERIQFIVYNKQSEFKQSNLGLANDEQYNIGGVTRIVGTKVAVYFEGDHQKLEEQIRGGIAEVLINQMMYGGNLKDMFKNATLLALPEWFMKGLVSHVANKWNADIDNKVRDGILNGRYNKFNRLTGADALYAGHSIWNYIAETYGDGVISNVLYMTRVSRNVESAFLFVLGVSMKSLSRDYLAYYQLRYDDQDKTKLLPTQVPVVKKPKVTRVYTQAKISPDGNYMVYVTNELGQYKVWLQNLKESKRPKRIIKSGHKLDRINDYSYPLLAWHPTGLLFSMITEEKGELYLTQYTLETRDKAKRTIINFDKILDFSYSDDGKKFAMSAVQKGQSDIFVFTAASNGFEQITKDIYDDLNPRFVHGSKEIVFSSNRSNDTIRFETENNYKANMRPTKDLFVFNYISKSNTLRRLTNTPTINETNPADYDSSNYSFISDQSGIRNRYIAHFDSVISYVDTSAHYRFVVSGQPVTNFSRNIIEQDINVKANKYVDIIYSNGKYWIYPGNLSPVTALVPVDLKNTAFRDDRLKEERKGPQKRTESQLTIIPVETLPVKSPDILPVKRDSGYVDINNYTFENEKGKSGQRKEEVKKEEPKPPVVVGSPAVVSDSLRALAKRDSLKKEFKLSPQKNYYINFATDYVVTQLDNSYLNSSYQRFTGGGSPVYLNPGFNGLFKIGLSDLFEDYRIVSGVRLGTNLDNNEYFMSYENRVHNLDRQLVLHRQSFQTVANGSMVKLLTHDAKYSLKLPFSEVACLKGTATLRNDRTVFLATDFPALKQDYIYETWASGKLEYIFDNTLNKGLNLFNGTRLKVFAEYYRRIDRSSSILPSPLLTLLGEKNSATVNDNGTDFVVAGFDVRHYQKIHRNLIWASRIAGSTSFGKQKLVYYMGGVDNWFSPRFDNSINIATDQNYAYQTLATPVRGFYQNIRNGNTFVVLNNELRWPIFKYFLNRPIRSDFINNFQIIGFGDLGTAWTGPDPYSSTNSLNTRIINRGPITVTISSKREPLVGGYGFGLRSRIWGYFVRVDWAWGVEDRIILPRILYLSFSLDF
ncbi:MAG: PD40 domain-containing protein [Bacteroidia bacterium]|nr:PD40 domain-containing protein [Bacteroidia bacterium]